MGGRNRRWVWGFACVWVWLALLEMGCRRVERAETSARTAEQEPSAKASAGARDESPAPDAEAEAEAEPEPETAPAPDGAVHVSDIFRTRESPIAATVKIFLFAGSSQNANFAQEIVDQKALWMDAGFREEEIACYYVVPYQEEFEADRAQYLALAGALASCHRASVKRLRAHLRQSAGGPFVYLYVTAHGQRPVSLRLADAQPEDEDYHALRRQAAYPILDEYRIAVEALPDGTASGAEVLGAYRAGVDARELYLTPAHLAGFLEESYAGMPKFVVLQGCFSGGFVRDARPGRGPSALTRLPGITVLAAARNDRESFGCGSADTHTYYGGIFLEELERRLASPLRMDWRALHEAVRARVAALEAEVDLLPSEPVFFSSAAPG